MRDTDSKNYYPLKDGTMQPSSPKMRPMTDEEPLFIFDEHYNEYLAVKAAGRAERLGKYYRRLNEDIDMKPVIRMILKEISRCNLFHTWTNEFGQLGVMNKITGAHLVFDDGLTFSNDRYIDSFDALASQLQCDLVLFTARPDGSNYASHIHLFHPNGWSAEGWIGKSFEQIHEEVLNSKGGLVIPNPTKFGTRLTQMTGSVERVGALSFRTDTRLNRHPDGIPGNYDNIENLFLRFERQTVTGIPEARSFLFSIHSIFCDLTRHDRIDSAIEAITSAGPDVYPREVLKEHGAKFLNFLRGER